MQETSINNKTIDIIPNIIILNASGFNIPLMRLTQDQQEREPTIHCILKSTLNMIGGLGVPGWHNR